MRRIDVETAAELAEAARAEFASTHVLVMAAAPADFRAAEVAPGKLKREGAARSSCDLEPTEDILAGRRRRAAARARRSSASPPSTARAGSSAPAPSSSARGPT